MGNFTEAIEHWASDFLTSTRGELAARDFGERAGAVLVAFMENACGSSVPPDEITEREIRDGVAIGLGPLDLSQPERESVPGLLQEFLEYCEGSGRLGGGSELGAVARVSATAHLLKKQTRKKTIKVGPNDPCPCGSGRKYKKCCMRA
jgi:hypothetical protein